MKNTHLLILLILLIASCSPSNGIDEQIELRIINVQHSLAMTHNSHLNRSFPSERSSFSVTISFELFLSEGTDYTNIHGINIIDEELEGWDFSHSEVLAAYNSDFHSLSFQTLDLRKFDVIANKLFKAQILDEEGEVVREIGFELDNSLPLPALTTNTLLESDQLEITFDFYETPFDGGSIPFPVKIYNTIFSSQSLILTWLNDNKEAIHESYHNMDSLKPIASPNTDDIYTLLYSKEEMPEDATHVYARFQRGGSINGRALLTKIDEIKK